jgi:hypothetical protein
MAVALFGICRLTDMSSYADVASLQQREQRIRNSKSRQKKAIAATKIAALEHLQDQNQTQSPDSSDEYGSDALHAEPLARSNHSRSSLENDHPSDDQDSIHSGTSSGSGDLTTSLLSDYNLCLGRLNVMQTKIEGAVRELSPRRAKCLSAKAKRKLVREVDENGRQTLLCLLRHVFESGSQCRILRKADHSPSRSPADTRTMGSLRPHEPLRSETGKFCFRLLLVGF